MNNTSNITRFESVSPSISAAKCIQTDNDNTFEESLKIAAHNNSTIATLNNYHVFNKYGKAINNTVHETLLKLLLLLRNKGIISNIEVSNTISLHINNKNVTLDDNDNNPYCSGGSFRNHSSEIEGLIKKNDKNKVKKEIILDKIREVTNAYQKGVETVKSNFTNMSESKSIKLDASHQSECSNVINEFQKNSHFSKNTNVERSEAEIKKLANAYKNNLLIAKGNNEKKLQIELNRLRKEKNQEVSIYNEMTTDIENNSSKLKKEYINTINDCPKEIESEANSYIKLLEKTSIMLAKKGLEANIKITDSYNNLYGKTVSSENNNDKEILSEVIFQAQALVSLLLDGVQKVSNDLKDYLEAEKIAKITFEKKLYELYSVEEKTKSGDIRKVNANKLLITSGVKELLANQANAVSSSCLLIKSQKTCNQFNFSNLIEDDNTKNNNSDDEFNCDISSMIITSCVKPKLPKAEEKEKYVRCPCVEHDFHISGYDKKLQIYMKEDKKNKIFICQWGIKCTSKKCGKRHASDICKNGSSCKNQAYYELSEMCLS
jgi:hypothetical protein